MFVLDYSEGWPDDITGYAGTVRYIGRPGHAKNITPEEVAGQGPKPVSRAFVYEEDAGWMLGGVIAGLRCAENVRMDPAWSAVGIRRLYLAVDFDAQPYQYERILACATTVTAALSSLQVGLYGSADMLDWYATATPDAPPGWQTLAWSHSRVSDHACLYQDGQTVVLGGVTCDLNLVLDKAGDFGQWLPPPLPAPPAGTGLPLAVRLAGRDET